MMLRLIPLLVLLLSMSLSARGVEIIACGGSHVVIYDADQPKSENPKLTWSWDVKEATKAEVSWWTHHIYSLNPARTFTFPGINLYKARTSSP